jgi:hypothetical protein
VKIGIASAEYRNESLPRLVSHLFRRIYAELFQTVRVSARLPLAINRPAEREPNGGRLEPPREIRVFFSSGPLSATVVPRFKPPLKSAPFADTP